jgi:LuxR family transcriptional regulator, activator of tox operons
MDRIFKDLGSLISLIGDSSFVANIHDVIAKRVRTGATVVAEIVTDDADRAVAAIRPFGTAGNSSEAQSAINSAVGCFSCSSLVIRRILRVADIQLIHFVQNGFYPRDAQRLEQLRFMSILVSHRPRRRYTIALCRNDDFTDFELTELRTLSETLLPIVEKHANARNCQARHRGRASQAATAQDFARTTLQRRFEMRLLEHRLQLSEREKQVCILLLSGETVSAIARQLNLRPNTVETYIRRAGIKLGASGRRGMAQWLLSATDLHEAD